MFTNKLYIDQAWVGSGYKNKRTEAFNPSLDVGTNYINLSKAQLITQLYERTINHDPPHLDYVIKLTSEQLGTFEARGHDGLRLVNMCL